MEENKKTLVLSPEGKLVICCARCPDPGLECQPCVESLSRFDWRVDGNDLGNITRYLPYTFDISEVLPDSFTPDINLSLLGAFPTNHLQLAQAGYWIAPELPLPFFAWDDGDSPLDSSWLPDWDISEAHLQRNQSTGWIASQWYIKSVRLFCISTSGPMRMVIKLSFVEYGSIGQIGSPDKLYQNLNGYAPFNFWGDKTPDGSGPELSFDLSPDDFPLACTKTLEGGDFVNFTGFYRGWRNISGDIYWKGIKL